MTSSIIWLTSELRVALGIDRLQDRAVAKSWEELFDEPHPSWQEITRLANEHGLQPLLFWQLKLVANQQGIDIALGNCISPALFQQLSEHFYSNTLHGIKLSQTLGIILAALNKHDIPVLALKGLALAQMIYPNPSLRELGDLDLLVRRADALPTIEILKQHGFQARASNDFTPHQEKAWIHFKGARHYRNKESKIEIDLHWQLINARKIGGFTFDALWERRQVVDVHGQAIPTLGPEDTLLYLCIHGAKHGWVSLKWSCDVAAFLETHRQINWDLIQHLAARAHATHMLNQGLALAARLFDAPLPPSVASIIESDQAVQAAVATIHARILAADGETNQSEYLYLSRRNALRISEQQQHARARRLIDWLRITFTPTGAEIQLLSLPPVLFPLYYLLRAGRLIWRWMRATIDR